MTHFYKRINLFLGWFMMICPCLSYVFLWIVLGFMFAPHVIVVLDSVRLRALNPLVILLEAFLCLAELAVWFKTEKWERPNKSVDCSQLAKELFPPRIKTRGLLEIFPLRPATWCAAGSFRAPPITLKSPRDLREMTNRSLGHKYKMPLWLTKTCVPSDIKKHRMPRNIQF